MHGAVTVGIEFREANIEKAKYAQRQLRLNSVTFYQDDVRNLSREKYGGFDIVFCAGILYHLDAPDVFGFVRRVHDVCDRVAIIDTFISLHPVTSRQWDGQSYWGLVYREHYEKATAEQKASDCWASIDNPRSFWLTHASLCNLLAHVGFSSLYECHFPVLPEQYEDRRTYVALRGPRAQVLSSPVTADLPLATWPERREALRSPAQTQPGPVANLVKRALPQQVKDMIKPPLRALGVLPPDATPEYRKARSARRSG